MVTNRIIRILIVIALVIASVIGVIHIYDKITTRGGPSRPAPEIHEKIEPPVLPEHIWPGEPPEEWLERREMLEERLQEWLERRDLPESIWPKEPPEEWLEQREQFKERLRELLEGLLESLE